MVYLSQTIINQVKEAKGELEVVHIIDEFISKSKIKTENGRISKKYSMNFLMALKYCKAKETDLQALKNINSAIEIFKKLHAQGMENVL